MEVAEKIKLEKGERLHDRTHESCHYDELDGVICTINEMCTVENAALFNPMDPALGTFARKKLVTNGERAFRVSAMKDSPSTTLARYPPSLAL